MILNGWVHEIRDLGGIKFLILRNRGGLHQVVLPKKKVSRKTFEKVSKLNREDVITVACEKKESKGKDFKFEYLPTKITVLNESRTPLPLDPAEKVSAGMDTRLDNRFLDLRKRNVLNIFKIRSELLRHVREFFLKEEFIEIHTPKIISSSSEGGTELFSVKYFEKRAYLSQSPQLYKQMMMAAGFDRIFEIAWYFRAEEHNTRRHLNESTAIDLEMAFIEDEEDIMKLLENLIHYTLKNLSENCKTELDEIGTEIVPPEPPFKRISYDRAIEILKERGSNIEWGDDLGTDDEKLLGTYMKENGTDYYFIKRFPKNKVFYIMPDGKYCRGFDLDCRGTEITSGGQRVHDHDLLVKRIEEFGMDPEDFEDYLKVFRYGMPPHGGFGMGIERFLMEILDIRNIRECILFPRDRNRIKP
ncbi:MAG: aspartate--tRNA(Asn) ligase [Euryarchaeota archaeon]|nr:aspartate--tRNA(Asn) ligase [Euryarchaeota archaeon]